MPTGPDNETVLRAVAIYMEHAYGSSSPSRVVQSVLETLRTSTGPALDSPAFVRSRPPEPDRHALRLGNRRYPHMKLVIEPSPDGRGVLFRADTHDRHINPPRDHPDHASFAALREENQSLASAIERAWAEAGIPTFKTYLRDDLARRAAGGRQP